MLFRAFDFASTFSSARLFLLKQRFTLRETLLFFCSIHKNNLNLSSMRLPRFELGTSTLSVSRSNQLSYNRKVA